MYSLDALYRCFEIKKQGLNTKPLGYMREVCLHIIVNVSWNYRLLRFEFRHMGVYL